MYPKAMSLTAHLRKYRLCLAVAGLLVLTASPTQAGSLLLNYFDPSVNSNPTQVPSRDSEGINAWSIDGTRHTACDNIGGLPMDSILRRDVYQTVLDHNGSVFGGAVKTFKVPEPASTTTTLLGSAVFGLSWLTRRVRGRILSRKVLAYERRRDETKQWLNTLLDIRY